MTGPLQIPYSKRGLENLAAALNINTALLWVSPVSSRLEVRDQDMAEQGLALGDSGTIANEGGAAASETE